jgi:MoaA/NifB/PqqE/SkfB family radical SAM enzyme
MYRYEDLRSLHLEVTTRCNASCGQCPRNIEGGAVNPALPLVELSLADARRIFPLEFVRQLRGAFLCGNYGDPMVAKDTLEILRYFREGNPKIRLKMHSNASGRDAAFWRSLAEVVDVCTFSIDGLSDTNHLYRRGTEWERIIDNARTFIAAGGTAFWDFIVFRHNQHQIEEARALSKVLGFERFAIRKTSRFWRSGRMLEQTPVRSRDGTIEYFLEPPDRAELVHDDARRLLERTEGREAHEAYLGETEIECKVVEEKQIYVSAEGLVFPCCWTASIHHLGIDRSRHQIWRLLDQLPEGKASLSGLRHSLREIVEGPFFQAMIPGGWAARSTGADRLKVCASVCGQFNVGRGVTIPLPET